MFKLITVHPILTLHGAGTDAETFEFQQAEQVMQGKQFGMPLTEPTGTSNNENLNNNDSNNESGSPNYNSADTNNVTSYNERGSLSPFQTI